MQNKAGQTPYGSTVIPSFGSPVVGNGAPQRTAGAPSAIPGSIGVAGPHVISTGPAAQKPIAELVGEKVFEGIADALADRIADRVAKKVLAAFATAGEEMTRQTIALLGGEDKAAERLEDFEHAMKAVHLTNAQNEARVAETYMSAPLDELVALVDAQAARVVVSQAGSVQVPRELIPYTGVAMPPRAQSWEQRRAVRLQRRAELREQYRPLWTTAHTRIVETLTSLSPRVVSLNTLSKGQDDNPHVNVMAADPTTRAGLYLEIFAATFGDEISCIDPTPFESKLSAGYYVYDHGQPWGWRTFEQVVDIVKGFLAADEPTAAENTPTNE